MTAKARKHRPGAARWLRSGSAGALLLSACSQLIGLDGDYYEQVGSAGTAGRAGSSAQGGSTSGMAGSDLGGGPNAGDGGSPSGAAGVEQGGSAGEAGDAGDGGEPSSSGGSAGVNGGGASGTGSNRAGAAGAVDAGAGGSSGSGGTGGELGAGGPPSCVGLAESCGPDGEDSCCRSAPVPGGEFDRSNDAAFPASVSPFTLDVYEATVGRFRTFVAAYDGTPPAPGSGGHPIVADSGWNPAWDPQLPRSRTLLKASLDCESGVSTWTDEPGANESRPVNCLGWYVAFAFCAWDGGRLPTEAEWNFAAAGGDEQRNFPWSEGPNDPLIDQTYASYYSDVVNECMGDGQSGCSLADFVTVGSKVSGGARWGHADMAGNIYEWVLDRTDGGSYVNTECDDCANLEMGDYRIARGGCFFSGSHLVATAARVGFVPAEATTAFGVRCVR